MPADWCPFCPRFGRVPEYDVYLYPNDFPAFSLDSEPFDPTPGLFRSTGARGACDVVLYSPDHNCFPSRLSVEQWRKVVDLWTRRYRELAEQPDIAYVMIFENTGEFIGVTMPHPHGQIYAFPFLPPLIDKQVHSASEYASAQQSCIFCDILAAEIAGEARLVAQNDSFVAFVPFAARFPAEVHVYSRRHIASLAEMQNDEGAHLAEMLSIVRRKYENLYPTLQKPPLPLMMVLYNAPVKGEHPYFHFHVQFLPLQRSATKHKYLAAVETAGGTYLADTRPEERAAELRNVEPVTG